MKVLINVMVYFLFANVAIAQQSLKETNGRLMSEVKYENLLGDQNLNPDWREAVIKFKHGKTAKLPVNIDLIAKTAFFRGETGEKMAFVDDVSSIEFLDGAENSAGSKMVKLDGEFYQVIAEGKVSLYKKLWKTIWEEREHNSATVTKTVVPRSAYFIFDGTYKLTPVKANKSLISAFGDQKSVIEQFVRKENLSFSKDTDLKKLIDYYNSL